MPSDQAFNGMQILDNKGVIPICCGQLGIIRNPE